MLLKSLELQGFKTFPDKTALSFGKGITAVVGPNGSGKSNISDAIRWVLGEQSTKTLRCSKMEDVVFNGTPIRKSQGFAEVTLTIDNADRKLDFDSDEVAITRRYYRSGESEYQINKASVRLKDIHDLFMDTGLGRDGYSVIGQGKIDSIVGARSEDRREVFEEAAGISRFRYRKTEAQRRLAQAEENLLRLRDIILELEGRVGPLAEQAQKARDYLEYAGEKRTLEIGLWLGTLERSGQVLREQEDKISIAQSQHDAAQEELERIRQETEEVFLKTNAHTARVDVVRREIANLEEQAVEKKNRVSLLENDILHNTENIDRIQSEIQQADASTHAMDTQIKGKLERIEAHTAEIEQKQRDYLRCEGDLKQLQQEMNRFTGTGEQLSRQLSDLTVQASESKVTAITTASSIQESQSRLQVVTEGVERRAERITRLEETLGEIQEMQNDAVERVNELSNTVRGYEIRLNTRRQKLEGKKQQADTLTLDAEERIRRTRLLEELERNLEGFAQSVKIVMKESNRGLLSGIHGPVSRILKVPGQYAVAMETALGAAMQNIVVGTEQDAKRAIEMLKQRDGGRATFLPLTTIRGNVLQENGLQDCMGFVGIASELCRCEAQYDGVRRSLLGRIAIAEDLDSAVTIAKRFHYKFRVVTLDGQVVNAGGSMTGGSLARNSGLLSRATEIERVRKEAEELKGKALEARNAYREAEAGASQAEAALTGAKGELASAQEERIRIEAECRNCASELHTLQKAAGELRLEQEELTQRIQELNTAKEQAEQNSRVLAEQIRRAEEQISSLSGNREQITARREQLNQQLQNIRLDMVSLQKDVQSLQSEIEGIEGRKLDHAGRIREQQAQIEEIEKRSRQLKQEIAQCDTDAHRLRERAKEAQQKIEQLNQERILLEKRSVELRQKEREKSSERENIGRDLARMEERKAGLQKEYDEIIARLWEEYELTRREAEEISEKIDDLPAAQKRLNELKLKIKSLGSVNVGAIEEYQEVHERYTFMKEQVDDVERSKNELIRLIGDLTQQMRELFLQRFEQINQNFIATFRELFGGGVASLELSNRDDVLNSGIEISVQPPGKIKPRLEALSGGERALVAIALYFAIMKVNPPPFCVLDEIEAALDDINVDRFAAYLRRMNERTQFIVITHRRGTMNEADVLYGVTMQDEGVSKLLELRASELEQKLGIR
ncbi:MAG: chromosome segregation protein SMC [Clostridiales bacterium]|nr:chromosome segregation protein SMC [Clostridiales bacterium]